MFAVGHLALGHLLGYASSKSLKTKMNIPLILVLSIIPDIDMIIPYIPHRGPTHSIITATILFLPLFLLYKKAAIPYYAALIQHSLFGDLITGGKIQLLWPLTTQHYGMRVGIRDPANITAEWILFLISISIILKTKNTTTLLKSHHSNLLLTIPLSAVLLPTFLSFPLRVPLSLIPPHLAYTILFSTSIILHLAHTQNQKSVTFNPKI